MTRSIFLPHESYSDVQTALAQADTEEERYHVHCFLSSKSLNVIFSFHVTVNATLPKWN